MRLASLSLASSLLLAIGCGPPPHQIGGTVAGLSGSGLVLQDNGADDLPVSGNGPFVFASKVKEGAAYAVTVFKQPSSPTQACTVAQPSPTAAADVKDVAVTCVTSTFAVTGSVSGLAGSGLVLQDNGGDDLRIAANGAFSFARQVASGQGYAVTIKAQPTAPMQTCKVTGGTGTIGAGPASGIAIACVTNTYAVGGAVAGLIGSGLVLQDNAGDDLAVTANGSFTFATPVASGKSFAVTVKTQPSTPSQTCVVSAGSGTVIDAAVSTVAVQCTTNSYRVGGTVSGVQGEGLVLQDNLGDSFSVGADGPFFFATAVASGAPYSVTVLAQPTSPSQTCVVAGGAGTVGGGDVTSVAVTCTTNTYAVGGTISGLSGTVVLQDNGGDNLTLTANGAFVFNSKVASSAAYAVTVLTQPATPSQTCTVTSGSGTVVASDVGTVAVACVTNSFNVSVAISGLTGGGLVLQNNGGDNLSASGTSATFATKVLSGGNYNVTVLSQPTAPWQTCLVAAPSGRVGGQAVTVAVTCTTNSYDVKVTVSGLTGAGLVLQDNGADDLSISTNGDATFATKVASGAVYLVTVKTQPAGQSCGVQNGQGRIAGDRASVVVACGVTGSGTQQDPYATLPVPASCAAYKSTVSGTLKDGYYKVNPANVPAVVYCDQTTSGGGWTRCLTFTNTSSEDLSNNNWLDACVDMSNAAWAGTKVLFELRDPNRALTYNGTGTRVGTWSYDQLTSTAVANNQFHSGNQDRIIALDNGDNLMIAGRSSSNAGCGGSMGAGYGIVLYPSSPNYIYNPKMFVMPYRQFNYSPGTPRYFQGWTPATEISWNGGTSFNSCNSVGPGYLGTVELYLK